MFSRLESRDARLSAIVYLNKMVTKLTVLLGCKVKNEKRCLNCVRTLKTCYGI